MLTPRRCRLSSQQNALAMLHCCVVPRTSTHTGLSKHKPRRRKRTAPEGSARFRSSHLSLTKSTSPTSSTISPISTEMKVELSHTHTSSHRTHTQRARKQPRRFPTVGEWQVSAVPICAWGQRHRHQSKHHNNQHNTPPISTERQVEATTKNKHTKLATHKRERRGADTKTYSPRCSASFRSSRLCLTNSASATSAPTTTISAIPPISAESDRCLLSGSWYSGSGGDPTCSLTSKLPFGIGSRKISVCEIQVLGTNTEVAAVFRVRKRAYSTLWPLEEVNQEENRQWMNETTKQQDQRMRACTVQKGGMAIWRMVACQSVMNGCPAHHNPHACCEKYAQAKAKCAV